MADRPKSFETVLEEERREVLALLEKRPSRRPKRAGSSMNPRRASSPLRTSQRPVRSMLDIGNGSASARSPTAGTSTEGPQGVSTSSMLDIDSPEPADAPETESSAEGKTKGSHSHHRSLSDTTFRPADLHAFDADFILSSAYKLSGYLSSNTGPPKRNTQAGKIIKSSSSPRSSIINPDPNKLVLSDGRAVDKTSAYRRLSDTNLAAPGHRSSISSSGNSSGRASSGDATKPGRPILKNHNATPDDEEAVAESSEEDGGSSDEEQHRGRKKESRHGAPPEGKPLTVRVSKGPRSALGRAAAAERDGTLLPLQPEYQWS